MTIYCVIWNQCWKNLISPQMMEHVTCTAQFHASVISHTCIMWPPTCFCICVNSWLFFTQAYFLWRDVKTGILLNDSWRWNDVNRSQYFFFLNHWKTPKRSVWVILYPSRTYSRNEKKEEKKWHIFPLSVSDTSWTFEYINIWFACLPLIEYNGTCISQTHF